MESCQYLEFSTAPGHTDGVKEGVATVNQGVDVVEPGRVVVFNVEGGQEVSLQGNTVTADVHPASSTFTCRCREVSLAEHSPPNCPHVGSNGRDIIKLFPTFKCFYYTDEYMDINMDESALGYQ